MELIRARMFMAGYICSGQQAHEAEVSYLSEEGFPSEEILFLNELRYFRNSATYYGKILNAEYAGKVVEFTKKIHPNLIKLMSMH